MKKHKLLFTNIIIILSIVIGFICIIYKDTTVYQDLAEEHMEKTLSLADNNISNIIKDCMIKPLMVSKTMANDEFLKEWLSQEPKNADNDAYLKKVYNYLMAYQRKYDYTTVFCISAQTFNYYYQDGLNKTISKDDPHDVWYYNFIESGQEYDLQVDTNETRANCITLFINFRVESTDGRLLGVIGVGLQVNALEDTIRSYENDYGMSVYIINVRGAENSFTGDTHTFISEDDLHKRTGITEKIKLNNSEDPQMQWHTSGGERKSLITKYNSTLGWYLILEMNTNTLGGVFHERVKSNVAFLFIALAACIVVTTTVFINYNHRIVAIENTDELTGLPNRKHFAKKYSTFIRKHRKHKMTLFMFDVDHFKDINDTHGHMFGNVILSMVGEELRNAITGHGIAARWGGDEFLGILSVEPEEAKRILERYMDSLKSEEKDENYRVTVSIGITEIDEKLSMEQMVQKVDTALYRSKEEGRNQITIS